MRVRLAKIADLQAMMDLERQAPAAAHWSRQEYEDSCRTDSQPSDRVAWVVENDNEAQSESAICDTPEIVAFLVAHRIAAEWELENIVVDKTTRRRGIGALLLRELIAHARNKHGKYIFLEVRESNRSARALYEKLGFEQVGLRKNYYANPTEDAILYCINLR